MRIEKDGHEDMGFIDIYPIPDFHGHIQINEAVGTIFLSLPQCANGSRGYTTEQARLVVEALNKAIEMAERMKCNES